MALSLETFQTLYPTLTTDQYKKLETLAEIFCEKNKYINLTAIRDIDGIWEKHLFDSAISAQLISEKKPQTIADLGTGGGFPSLVLAILFPEIQFTSIDSVQKKLRCVDEFAQELGLDNVTTLWGRAEEIGRNKQYREQFDMVVSRACAPFPVLLELAMPLVTVQGSLVAYRGPESDADDEVLLEEMDGFLESCPYFELPSGDQRFLWQILKVDHSHKRFPREIGIPKKEPLSMKFFKSFS